MLKRPDLAAVSTASAASSSVTKYPSEWFFELCQIAACQRRVFLCHDTPDQREHKANPALETFVSLSEAQALASERWAW